MQSQQDSNYRHFYLYDQLVLCNNNQDHYTNKQVHYRSILKDLLRKKIIAINKKFIDLINKFIATSNKNIGIIKLFIANNELNKFNAAQQVNCNYRQFYFYDQQVHCNIPDELHIVHTIVTSTYSLHKQHIPFKHNTRSKYVQLFLLNIIMSVLYLNIQNRKSIYI